MNGLGTITGVSSEIASRVSSRAAPRQSELSCLGRGTFQLPITINTPIPSATDAPRHCFAGIHMAAAAVAASAVPGRAMERYRPINTLLPVILENRYSETGCPSHQARIRATEAPGQRVRFQDQPRKRPSSHADPPQITTR